MQVEISQKAEQELALRHKPLVAVVHLIFGCMVAKRVWFKDETAEETTPVTDKLSIHFDVVRYANCSLSNIDGGATPERFPLQKHIKGYVPDQLSIDFNRHGFSGDFTFSRPSKSVAERFDPADSAVMKY
jgi:hypothetical protein